MDQQPVTTPIQAAAEIEWVDDNKCVVNGQQITYASNFTEMFSKSGEHELVIAKPRALIEQYIALAHENSFKKIFELGIFRGGSTALLHSLYKPEKMVAIDYRKNAPPSLEHYINANEYNRNSIACYYHTDQADTVTLSNIMQKDFDNADLDLVIDDASHFLKESTASFNFFFPKLRSGGLYILEDWSWAHPSLTEKPPYLAEKAKQLRDKPSLAGLLFEIILASGSYHPLIDKIEVTSNVAFIWRSQIAYDGSPFDITQSYKLLDNNPIRFRH